MALVDRLRNGDKLHREAAAALGEMSEYVLSDDERALAFVKWRRTKGSVGKGTIRKRRRNICRTIFRTSHGVNKRRALGLCQSNDERNRGWDDATERPEHLQMRREDEGAADVLRRQAQVHLPEVQPSEISARNGALKLEPPLIQLGKSL